MDELQDKELTELASHVIGETALSNAEAVQARRDQWKKSSPRTIKLKELSLLLRDYQRLITQHHVEKLEGSLQLVEFGFVKGETYQFYHVKNVSQLHMEDLPSLLTEYKELLSDIKPKT